jgi:hypothetical protein
VEHVAGACSIRGSAEGVELMNGVRIVALWDCVFRRELINYGDLEIDRSARCFRCVGCID